MVGRATQVAFRPAHLASGRGSSPTTLWLPETPPEAEAPTTQETRSEHMICVTHAWIIFTDPAWGPISLQLSVWRDDRDDAPNYEVVIE